MVFDFHQPTWSLCFFSVSIWIFPGPASAASSLPFCEWSTVKIIARIANSAPVTMNLEIVVLNCQKCNQSLKGHKSLEYRRDEYALNTESAWKQENDKILCWNNFYCYRCIMLTSTSPIFDWTRISSNIQAGSSWAPLPWARPKSLRKSGLCRAGFNN